MENENGQTDSESTHQGTTMMKASTEETTVALGLEKYSTKRTKTELG